MDENQFNLKTDGYAGSVIHPVEGSYNHVAYVSPVRVSKLLDQLNEDFFVVAWDCEISI